MSTSGGEGPSNFDDWQRDFEQTIAQRGFIEGWRKHSLSIVGAYHSSRSARPLLRDALFAHMKGDPTLAAHVPDLGAGLARMSHSFGLDDAPDATTLGSHLHGD